mgnify:CR=1 FL=1
MFVELMSEEHYVVRIYRRSPAGPRARNGLVGIVEEVERERRIAFHNLDGLVAVFMQEPGPAHRRLRKGRMP